MFQNVVKGLNYSISLMLIRCTLLMEYLKLLYKFLNSLIQEVSALIPHQNSRASKPSENVLKTELHCCSYAIVLYWFSLGPSGQVINCCDNIP